MRNPTRLLYNRYVSQIALLSGVANATEKFTVDPTIQQKLVDKIQESSALLKLINMPLVTEQSASILGLGLTGTLASRTNTNTTDRATQDPSGLDERTYTCKQTNFDTAIKYAKLDAWAKFADFQVRIQNMITRQIALDMIMIGWNGTSAAVATDRVANPLLQDVNIGWLQKLRTEAPAHVLSDGADTAVGFTTKVTYGTAATADYANLDALVYDAIQLLPIWAREDPGLVVIVGSALLHEKYFPIINQVQDNINLVAADVLMSTKTIGGLKAVRVPFFPAGTIVITKLDNLSIYEQEGAQRRHVQDWPKRDQIENYQSGNYAYVIENLDYICMVENIANNDA